MIDLTPLEVRKKKGDFARKVRGYDPELVDHFLDLVADRLEELVRENMAMHERLERLEEQVAHFRGRERALTDALVIAQEVREEVKRQAAKEAELLRREAEAEASDIRGAAAQAREREEDALRRLRARRRQFLMTYRTFLEREMGELEVLTQSLDIPEEAEPPYPSGAVQAVEPPSFPLVEPVLPAASPGEAAQPEALVSGESEGAAREPSTPANLDAEPEWLSSILKEES